MYSREFDELDDVIARVDAEDNDNYGILDDDDIELLDASEGDGFDE